MAFTVPRLDHVVVDLRYAMDEAVRVYRSVGFYLTGRGRHTLGSINHLAVFDTDYLELLGIDENATAVRPDILQFPLGLNGLVFATDNADALFNDLQERDVPVEEPLAFSRPVRLETGNEDAKFRVVRLRAGAVSFGRVYFCEHLTPHLVWRPEWRQHPNGAMGVAGMLIAARDPDAASLNFVRMFGPDAARLGANGARILAAGNVRIELVSPKEVKRRLGDAAPDPAGRADYMASLSIRTASLAQAAQSLQIGGIDRARIEPQRILVPARDAMNVAIQFLEHRPQLGS